MREIRLITIDSVICDELADQCEFEEKHEALLGDNADLIVEVVRQNEDHRRSTGADPRWGGHLAVDASSSQVIGTCAFKGAPDAEKRVEIAYFTFPAFEGRGFATAMACELEQQAAASCLVSLLLAYTLPEENASTRVLRRLDYRFVGEITDPEDGLVWRWERSPRSRVDGL